MIPAWVRNYEKLPFREKGRDRRGLDCWGLVCLVLAEQAGILLPDFLDFGWERGCDQAQLALQIIEYRKLFTDWEDVDLAAARAFDVLWLRIGRAPFHFAVVTCPGWMLHCEEGVAVAHERYGSFRWQRRVLGASRHV